MGNYTDDSTEVKHSHNLYKNKKASDQIVCRNNRIKHSPGVNINTVKADSYNWLMGIVCLLCIVFSISAVVASYYISNQALKAVEDLRVETNKNFETLQKIFIEF